MLLNLLLQITSSEVTLEGEASAPTEDQISIIELIINGGWYIMIPLGILSVVAVYIFVERFFTVQKAAKEDPKFMDQIRDFIHDGKIDAANHLCKQTNTLFARMVQKGIKRIGRPLSDISASVENVAKLEVYKLEDSISTLATVAGAAPMIGFLGTVIGMIVVFHEIRISQNGIEIEQLSGGIMQAMVTTVAGLIIGIIAYVGYNILVSRIQKVIYKMETTTIEFMDLLQEPSEK